MQKKMMMKTTWLAISLCAVGSVAIGAQAARETRAERGAQPAQSGQAAQGARAGGAGATGAATPARGGAAGQRQPASPPYITGDAAQLFDVLPPAPVIGDARDEADRKIFRQTRALYNTPRWEMAAHDAQLGNDVMLEHFSCSLGIELKAEDAPRIVAITQKVTREAAASMSKAKDFYQRHRPFKADVGPTCVPESTIGESFDYPSGHTTAGWAWALVLAQVDPSRAVPILARGRAIGDSRVVCGMHNASAVENARMLTGAAVSLASASPLYQADLAYARAELAKLREGEHKKPDPARCAVEAELIKPYW